MGSNLQHDKVAASNGIRERRLRTTAFRCLCSFLTGFSFRIESGLCGGTISGRGPAQRRQLPCFSPSSPGAEGRTYGEHGRRRGWLLCAGSDPQCRSKITRLRFRVRIFRRRSAFIFSFLLFGIVRVSDRQTLHGIGGHAYRIYEYV